MDKRRSSLNHADLKLAQRIHVEIERITVFDGGERPTVYGLHPDTERGKFCFEFVSNCEQISGTLNVMIQGLFAR